MTSDWKECKLGDICSRVTSGGTPKTTNAEYYENGTIPWLNTKEVHFNRIYSTEKNITEAGLNNSSAKWISKNNIIVAMYGATAGNVAINKIPLTTNQACCNLEIDATKADYNFIYYYLLKNYNILSSMANGGAQQNLNSLQIKDFDILLPPLETQRKIAKVLGAIDDKIELNNSINQNLEQQAMALYDNLISRNKDSLEERSLSEIANITMGQSPDGSSYNEDGNGTVFYQGRAEFGFRYPTRRLYTTEPKRMAYCNDVLMSVRAPVGDINVAYEDCCIGRGLAAIQSKNNTPSFILYTMFNLKKDLNIFNGEGTIFGSINKDSLNSLKLHIPSREEILKFEQTVSPLDKLIKNNCSENIRLTQHRDTLLPKLMSGEIDVDKVEVNKI